jgi:hypothetical protein
VIAQHSVHQRLKPFPLRVAAPLTGGDLLHTGSTIERETEQAA